MALPPQNHTTDWSSAAAQQLALAVASIPILLSATGWVGTPARIGTILAYVLAFGYLLDSRRLAVSFSPVTLVPLLGITAIFVVHIVLGNYASMTLIAFPFYTLFIMAMNLYVLPRSIPRERFFAVVAVITTAVALAGVPALFLERFIIGPIELTAWQDVPFGLGIEGQLRSFLENPNTMGGLLFAGFGSSLAIVYRSRSLGFAVIAVLDLILLGLTGSRAAIGAAIVTVLGYAAYRVGGRVLLGGATVAGGAALTALVFARIGAIPDFPLSSAVSFSNRSVIWRTSIEAASERPLFGHGLYSTFELMDLGEDVLASDRAVSSHNSYIYTLVRTGLVGMLLYGIVVWAPIVGAIKESMDVRVGAMVAGFTVISFVETISIQEIAATSILFAILLGYLIADVSGSVYVGWLRARVISFLPRLKTKIYDHISN